MWLVKNKKYLFKDLKRLSEVIIEVIILEESPDKKFIKVLFVNETPYSVSKWFETNTLKNQYEIVSELGDSTETERNPPPPPRFQREKDIY